MKPTIEQLAAHNRLLTHQADNMEAEIERLMNENAELRKEIERLKSGYREQLSFKGNNPFVSYVDYDHLYDIAHKALNYESVPLPKPSEGQP